MEHPEHMSRDITEELFTNKRWLSVPNIAGSTCFADCFDGLMQIDAVTDGEPYFLDFN